MSDYAQLENDIVVNVVVAESDWVGLTFGTWVEYDNEVNPAMIGSTYNWTTNMFEWFDEVTQTWIVLCPPVSG